MKKMTFNEFCYHTCDGLYDPNFSDEEQSTGYKQLKNMVKEGIHPASLWELERWENEPTRAELLDPPSIRYLRFLHPLARKFVIENWLDIVTLKIEEDVKETEKNTAGY